MTEHLRPLRLGEILDRTAQLYRRNFLTFAGTAAAPTAITVLLFAAAGGAGAGFGHRLVNAGNAPGVLAAGLVLFLLVAIPVITVATVVAHAALTLAAVGAHLGQPLKILAALKSVWPHFGRYLWLVILEGLVLAGVPGVVAIVAVAAAGGLGALMGGGAATGALIGFVTFLVVIAAVVYMILVGLRIAMALAVCVVEDKPAWDSIKRAAGLSRGATGRIFVMFLLVWAISMVLSMIGYIPAAIAVGVTAAVGQGSKYADIALVVSQILNILTNFAMQTLITPVYVSALVLFYYDQRVRTEGYDIEWMMQQAGLTAGDTPQGTSQTGVTYEPPATPDTLKGL